MRLKFFHYLGVDKTILYTIISRAAQAMGGLLSIYLVVRFLSKDEQGFYFTFISLLSIQIFFELGLSNIIVQYVAHEFAHISDENLNIIDKDGLSGLSAILRFFTKWYSIIAVILTSALIIIGICFFSRFNKSHVTHWIIPWIILAFSTGLIFVITFFLAFIEGTGRIKLVAKIRLIQQSLNVALTCLLLIFGAKLYTSGIATLVVSLVSIFLISSKSIKTIFRDIWTAKGNVKFDYKSQIFPYQWRIAISWIGGYLIFQMFDPVIFAFSGAKAAGQMGATLAILNGILTLSLSWVSTKVAYWSRLIALHSLDELNKSFKTTLFQSSFINLLALVVFYLFVKLIGPYYPSIQSRFIDSSLLALFASTFFFNNVINCWATYLRCFKKEPFLVQATIVGVLSGLSTFFLGKYHGIQGLIWGYFLITILISLPLSAFLFSHYKAKFNQSSI